VRPQFAIESRRVVSTIPTCMADEDSCVALDPDGLKASIDASFASASPPRFNHF
jgi:hypothetical protein